MDKNRFPLVSVIIPTYNRLRTLPASLDSVLRQTYDNLEVLVVDDGSDDGTAEYVRGISDSRVRYVNSDGNNGPSAARNKGAGLAQGEYLAFQDSDDEWLPNKLEKQMKLLLESGKEVALVYCEFTRYCQGLTPKVVPSRKIPCQYKQGDMFAALLLQPLISTQTIVVKKKDFLEEGGFDETLRTMEDYEFTLRFSRCHGIGFVGEPLVRVNDSPDSVDKRYGDRIRTLAYIVREMAKPLRTYGILWDKLDELQHHAVKLNCHDIFIEEMYRLSDLFVTAQDRENAARLVKKTERSTAKQNQYKESAYEGLVSAKQMIVREYINIFGDKPVDADDFKNIWNQAMYSLEKCGRLFSTPPDIQGEYGRLADVDDPDGKLEQLTLLTDMVKVIELLEREIGGQRYKCKVCGETVFINEEKTCPICGASEGESLLK